MTTNEILILLGAIVLLALAIFVAVGMQRVKARAAAEIAAREAGVPISASGPAPAAGPAATPAEPLPPAPALAAGVDSPFLAIPDGEADDLIRIKGIGPKLSALLNGLGVFHYRQIAGWTPEQLAIVDAQLGQFQGRPERDQWQSQAGLLASGDVKAYERLHGKLGS